MLTFGKNFQMEPAAKKYSIGVHAWISTADGHFLGRGRVLLLENIKAAGSISGAAKAMQMSYRQAWQMVEDMNRNAGTPLVEKILGGKGGGGAIITAKGDDAIRLFHRVEEEIKKLADEISGKIMF